MFLVVWAKTIFILRLYVWYQEKIITDTINNNKYEVRFWRCLFDLNNKKNH